MNNIDLPDYLKKSRFLNNLSIRRLLQHWAVICVLAVITLSLTALITNDIISSKQEILDKKYIPLGNLAWNLDKLVTEMELRQKSLINAASRDDFERQNDHYILESQIAAYLQQLSTITTDINELKFTVPGLQKKFDDYFAQDKKLLEVLSGIIKNDLPASGMDRLHDNYELMQINSNMKASIDDLRATLDRLTSFSGEKLKFISSQSYDLSQINLVIVVTVSLLVISIILAGISLVIFRIDSPLHKLSAAMHDLSSGDLSRRMKINKDVKDEFSVLTVDFNHFAERNQSLFDEVIDAKNALEESEKRVRAILENALVGIAHVKDNKILAVNRKFEEIFGYEREEIKGMKKEILYPSPHIHEAINDAASQLLANDETYQGEWKMRHKNGAIFWCAVSAKSISTKTGAEGIIWLFEDITQRKKTEEELLHLANYDSLTELPNRSLFLDRLEQGFGRTKRQKSQLGLLYIDLDRFKKINDSFGHTVGDTLLISVAERLCQCVRGSDTACRLGGDEFTIILPEIQDISDAGKVAEKIITLMDEPFSIEGHEINISPSIGVSIYPDDAEDIESLLKNADSAMYHAKSRGRNNYQYYTQAMNAEARLRLDKENRLRHAVEYDQFRLYYQPQVDTTTLAVTGYEALIRWQDVESGLVSPDQFVPLLEDTGLIVPVGEWIIRRACKDIPKLQAMNKDFKSVSINLSARQFVDNTIVERIKLIMEESAISPEYIVIEITETIMMEETERSLETLSELSNFGFQLSLDDFGTGYSSLAYLKQFPINAIKIDRSFVRELENNSSDAAICEAIITIARQLGLKVVAEGVETREQFIYMRDKGCHLIQGYYFGKASPIEELMCKVDKHHVIQT